MHTALKILNNLPFGVFNVLMAAILIGIISIVPAGTQPGLLILLFISAANALVALVVVIKTRFHTHKKRQHH